MALTKEMHVALTALREMGMDFHVVEDVPLDCGCVVHLGWDTSRMERRIRATCCSPEHVEAAERVMGRWEDPDVVERFTDTFAGDSFKALMAEELERGS